jgi:predicted ATPase
MTDIVDSTRLWALHPSEMAGDLELHDATVGGVVASSGGSVFKHTGDGAIAVFADPVAAMMAAIAIQRVMGSTSWTCPEPIQVRVAVNTGTVVERDGDFYGSPVNRVARLVSRCPPGAVLVGNATATLLAESSLGEVALRPAGRVELKGFGQPELVYAVAAAGLGEVEDLGAPAVGWLPVAEERLVGRGEELKWVMATVLEHPVVSIVGVGGMGKTRLAQEAATGLAMEFADGAWWCDLSVATSLDAVAYVVLEALGTRQAAGRSPMESIVDRLVGRRALLVMDNCAHVLEAAREVAQAVRASCRTVRVLATGREALGVRGEQVIPLSSLPVDDAVALFVDRANAVGANLGDEDREAVRQVCVRLDGIPLAVELAAARCRSITPGEISERLTDRFRLLRSGRPTSERHRTLQAAVAWSYDLLTVDERELFDRMAVFADGCLVDGIATIAGLDELDALDLLDALVARSMVTAVATPLGTRYRQLETLRQYAEDRLVERGVIGGVRDRHLDWVEKLAAAIGRLDGTSSVRRAFLRYCAELDNIRLAVAHAMDSGRTEAAKAIVAEAWRFAPFRPTVEMRQWFDPLTGTPPWTETAAQVVGVHAFGAFLDADLEAMERLIAAVPSEFHNKVPSLMNVMWLAEAFGRGDVDAADAIAGAYRPRTEFERFMVANQAVMAGYTRMRLGDLDPGLIQRTRRGAADNLAGAKATGDELAIAMALQCAALAHFYSGGLEDAGALAAEAIVVADSIGAGALADAGRIALGLARAGMAKSGEREPALVADDLREAIDEARRHNNRLLAAKELDAVAVLISRQDPERAYLLSVLSESLLPLGTLLDDETIATIDARRREELAVEARLTPLDDAIVLALDLLDRYYPRTDSQADDPR